MAKLVKWKFERLRRPGCFYVHTQYSTGGINAIAYLCAAVTHKWDSSVSPVPRQMSVR